MPSGALGALLGVSQLLYLGAMLGLGGRLLARALRSRDRAEAYLAVHFLLCCSFGYALLGGGLALSQSPGLLSPAAVAALVGAGQLCSGLGVLAGAAFTQCVFRPQVRWARALLGGLAGLLALSFLAGLASGGFARGAADPWYRVAYAGYVLAAAWVLAEPLRYRALMRRRALGLAEPLLVNRFLLWGVGSVFRFGMLVVGAVSTAVPLEGLDAATMALVLTTAALLGLGVAGAYWLTFFPPEAYVRLVGGRPAAERSGPLTPPRQAV
jgi:hypothetical protein